MKYRILFVSNDPNEYDNCRECLRKELREDFGKIEVDWEKNIHMAKKCLRKITYQLVITDLFIAQDSDSAVVEKDKGGVELLKGIKDFGLPSILVVPASSVDLQDDVDDIDRCRMVVKGSSYEAKLIKFSKRLLRRVPVKIENTGYIHLTLDLNTPLWLYEIKGEFGDRNYRDGGLLEIRPDKMKSLIRRSHNIETVDDWEEELRDIGNTLFEEIINRNYKFSKSFQKLVNQIKDKDKIKIHFSVEREIHPVILEALTEDQCFVMLNSPVSRGLNVSGEYPDTINPSKKGQRFIKCLIVLSEVGDTIVPEVDPEIKFPRLKKIKDEVNWLREFLLSHDTEFNIAEVKIVEQQPEGKSYLEYLEETIKSDSWDLVHYSGHSFYQKNSRADNYGKGYLLFPGEITPSALPLEKFSKWLRDCDTKFVFFNSCQSAEENFVFELARNCIPAIIGFRMKIDDDKAFSYAKNFYTHFFQDKSSIENAFFQTRKDMHYEYPKNRIWASPMLIMQGKEYL